MSDAAELRARLAQARAQQGLGTERAKELGLVDPETMPTPAELARQQVADAIARGRLDLSGAPRWPWEDLDDLVGPMLPGDLAVVFALTGNGKTTFLLSAMEEWARRETSTLFIPLEMDAHECRARWAAWKLGLNPVHVLRNQWDALDKYGRRLMPEGARDDFEATLHDQIASPYIHFATPKFITTDGIGRWVRWAHANLGVRQVVLDHFQRVDHQGGQADAASHRLAVQGTARMLRDLARELGIVIVAAAQANRSPDPLDAYKPPLLARLKDAAGIGEEAVSVITLSRKLDPKATKQQLAQVRAGTLEETAVALAGQMLVTCRKHRLDGEARDRRVTLYVRNGKVESFSPRESPQPPTGSRYADTIYA